MRTSTGLGRQSEQVIDPGADGNVRRRGLGPEDVDQRVGDQAGVAAGWTRRSWLPP